MGVNKKSECLFELQKKPQIWILGPVSGTGDRIAEAFVNIVYKDFDFTNLTTSSSF